MNDYEITTGIARLDGWSEPEDGSALWLKDGGIKWADADHLPNYLTSRDAIVPVIENTGKQPGNVKFFTAFSREFLDITNNESGSSVGVWERRNMWDFYRMATATPRQFCIALLKATEKWKD